MESRAPFRMALSTVFISPCPEIMITSISGQSDFIFSSMSSPLTPGSLALAEVLINSNGVPAYIREGAQSPKAELFPTGILNLP